MTGEAFAKARKPGHLLLLIRHRKTRFVRTTVKQLAIDSCEEVDDYVTFAGFRPNESTRIALVPAVDPVVVGKDGSS